MKKQVVVLAGPSGSGKNSIMRELMKVCPNTTRLVTATDRKPREVESHGVDYYFVSRQEFLDGIESGNIPEHQYREERDMYYGILLSELNKQKETGKTIISQVQIIGAKYLKEYHDAVTIFIAPESLDELEGRIRSRSSLSEGEIAMRLQLAQKEMEHESSWYDYMIMNANGKIQDSIKEIVSILKKEGITCG